MNTESNLANAYRTPIDSDYNACLECRAEFWVHSNEFTREDLIALLAPKVPIDAHIPVPKNRKGPSQFKGVFSITSDKAVTSKDLRHHIDWICDALEDMSGLDQIHASLETRGSITCFWDSKNGMGGPAFLPSQLVRLGQLYFEFSVNFSYLDHDS